MAPPPCAFISRATACATRNEPFRLTSITASQSASVMSRKSAALKMPALLTSALTGPSACCVAASAASTSALRDTSQRCASVLAPCAFSSAARACTLGRSTSHNATLAPSRARRLRAGLADALRGAGDHRDAIVQCERRLDPCAQYQDLRSSQQASPCALSSTSIAISGRRASTSVKPCSARRCAVHRLERLAQSRVALAAHRAAGCRSRPSRRSGSAATGPGAARRARGRSA